MAALDSKFTPGLIDEVQNHITRAAATGARVTAVEAIISILEKAGLAYKQQVPPEYVGIHPKNRSGLMLAIAEVHAHGAEILKTGWSWRKAADATAFEAPPDASVATVANERIVRLSQEMLPPLVTCRLLSVGASHTNAFLRAVKAGCKTLLPSLDNGQGRMSLDHLSVDRPEFREAVQAGLVWTVLHHQCDVAWPGPTGLCSLIQGSLNTRAQSDQGEVEILLELSALREAAEAAGVEPEWKAIVRSVQSTLPRCSSYVDELAKHVRVQAPELLVELQLFTKSHVRAAGPRACGVDFWNKLNGLKFGGTERYPYVMLSMVEANLHSPKVSDGLCKLISPTALSGLTNATNRENVRLAEQLMHHARRILETMGISEEPRVSLIGRLDVRCALFLTKMGKSGLEGKAYDSLAAIAEVVVQ